MQSALTAETMRLLSFIVLLSCLIAACGDDRPFRDTPNYVDMARVAEALRAADLSAGCGSFADFSRRAAQVLSEVEGASRFAAAATSYSGESPPEGGVSPGSISEPALLRLLLARYLQRCSSRSTEELAAALIRMDAGPNGATLVAALAPLMAESGLAVRSSERCLSGAEVRASGDDGHDPAFVELAACLRCGVEEGAAPGHLQIAAAVHSLRALSSLPGAPSRPVRLLLCASEEQCGLCRAGRGVPEHVIALDGARPVVFAHYGQVRWVLALPHRPRPGVLAFRPLPGARQPAATGPFVVDANAEAEHLALPTEAWMRLVDPQAPEDLAPRLEQQIPQWEEARPGASFSVERGEGGAVIRARRPAARLTEIREGHNVLWDLADVARVLDVRDLSGGSVAAMLRVVARFDDDPHGGRLGLYYEEPGVGPLLASPTGISLQGGRAAVVVTMLRPPGLERAAFMARLDDARERLSAASRRVLGEVERHVGEPRVVDRDEAVATAAAAAWEYTTGDVTHPQASTAPGLAARVAAELALGVPVTDTGDLDPRATTYVADFLWLLERPTAQ